jgi:hypothetical protein
MNSSNGTRTFRRWMLRSLILAISILTAISASAQRDHLTDPETDLVRFYQEIDKRTEVFIKAADRRFAIINGTAQPATKNKSEKDEPGWGDIPKGTHAQLLGDIAGILDEAITNIDNVSSRDPKNPLVPRALRKLTAAVNGYIQQLNSLKTKTTDADEIAALERINDEAKEIIEASGHLPSGAVQDEQPDKKGKKKKP